jgi:hypothetical protein
VEEGRKKRKKKRTKIAHDEDCDEPEQRQDFAGRKQVKWESSKDW